MRDEDEVLDGRLIRDAVAVGLVNLGVGGPDLLGALLTHRLVIRIILGVVLHHMVRPGWHGPGRDGAGEGGSLTQDFCISRRC